MNNKAIVYIHGLYGSHQEVEEYTFLNKEYDLIGLEYQDGNPWEVGEIIKKRFKEATSPYEEVIVIAYSIGAFYTYEFLSDFNIKQAFFISPVASMPEIIKGIMFLNHIGEKELKEKKLVQRPDGMSLSYDYNQYLINRQDCWNVPTEILYGTNDKLISFKSVQAFLNAHPNTKLTIKQGSEHYFHTPEEKDFIKNWISQNLNHNL